MTTTPTTNADFRAAVDEVGRAVSEFVSGESRRYRSVWARDEDVTIFGAWGDHERGWQQVGPRLDWAAQRFVAGHTSQEVLATGASGDLGYSVSLERGQAQVVGQTTAAPMLLRVTHIRTAAQRRRADPIPDDGRGGARQGGRPVDAGRAGRWRYGGRHRLRAGRDGGGAGRSGRAGHQQRGQRT